MRFKIFLGRTCYYFQQTESQFQKLTGYFKLIPQNSCQIVLNLKRSRIIRGVRKQPVQPCKLITKYIPFIRRLVDEIPRNSSTDIINETKELCVVRVYTTTIKNT